MSTDDRASLADLLSGYENADQVADRITATGVKGLINEPCECAVARYVMLFDFAKVDVLFDENDQDFVVYADDEVFNIEREDPVGEFIQAFDRRAYPHLIGAK